MSALSFVASFSGVEGNGLGWGGRRREWGNCSPSKYAKNPGFNRLE